MANLDTSELMVNGVDVAQLDDDELYSRLQDLGSPVGPIVATTRSVYEKKLYVLLGGKLSDSPTYNGDVDQEYSDNEPEVVADIPRETRNRVVTETSSHRTVTTKSNISPSTSYGTDVRKRLLISAGDDSPDAKDVMYDPDLHTPSPRRSLRTVTSSTSETTNYRRFVTNATANSRSTAGKGTDVVGTAPETGSSWLRLLVKLLFLALLIGVALYFYQNNPTDSPFKAIEELARQAIEAAAGEEAVDSPESVDKPATAPPPAKEPQVTN